MHSLSENTFVNYYHRLQTNLQHQLETRRHDKLTARREQKRIHGAVEAIIEGTDIRLRGVKNYHKELAGCAGDLLEHIESLVGSMPPPVMVDSDSLIMNPLVRTLLSDIKIVQRLLIGHQDIKDFFNELEDRIRDEVYAILFVRHQERAVLGSELHGEILLREVRQTSLSFYGHRLVGPSPTEEDVRFEMLVTLFESVVRYIKDQFLEEKKKLIDHKKGSVSIRPDESIINPKVYLHRLVQSLSDPTQLIKLEDKPVRLTKMGIKLQLDSPTPSDLLRLYELQIGDADSCVVSIIRYPRDGLSVRNESGMSWI